MKHLYSKINDSESIVNEILNTCDFEARPFPNGKQGKHMFDVAGYHICPLKGTTLSGRGVKETEVFDPRSGKPVKGYSISQNFYNKLLCFYHIAENKDAHWDGMIVR